MEHLVWNMTLFSCILNLLSIFALLSSLYNGNLNSHALSTPAQQFQSRPHLKPQYDTAISGWYDIGGYLCSVQVPPSSSCLLLFHVCFERETWRDLERHRERHIEIHIERHIERDIEIHRERHGERHRVITRERLRVRERDIEWLGEIPRERHERCV